MDSANLHGAHGKTRRRTKQPSWQSTLELFTDGNDDYSYVLPKCFPLGLIDYGQLVKVKEHGRLVRKERMVVYGVPLVNEIETTDVENFNGILRERPVIGQEDQVFC